MRAYWFVSTANWDDRRKIIHVDEPEREESQQAGTTGICVPGFAELFDGATKNVGHGLGPDV